MNAPLATQASRQAASPLARPGDHGAFDLALARRTLFSLADAAGVEIVCQRGSLWITLDHDPRDVVLDAGQRFCTAEHRRAIVYALEDSALSVASACARTASNPRRGEPSAAAMPSRAGSAASGKQSRIELEWVLLDA